MQASTMQLTEEKRGDVASGLVVTDQIGLLALVGEGVTAQTPGYRPQSWRI